MSDGFRSPFKDASVSKASEAIKPNLGGDATAKPSDAGVGSVSPQELPKNDLHHGTPDHNRHQD